MTAIGTRPSGIVTLEQELVRLQLAYFFSSPRNTIAEELNLNTPWAVFDVKPNPEGRVLFVSRTVVELTPLVDENVVKLFMRAKETVGGTANLPLGFDSL